MMRRENNLRPERHQGMEMPKKGASFEDPVTLLVGLGFPRRIGTVLEAYAFLQEWPQSCRNDLHRRALAACKAGIAGKLSPERVRNELLRFAQSNDILLGNDVVLADPGSTGRRGTVTG